MMNHKRFGAVLSLALALGWSGCSSEIEDQDDQFRIIEGDPASSAVTEYAATVGIHSRSGSQVSTSPFCSGTLITSDVVLTAAHCCDEANGGPNFNPMEADEAAVYFGDGPAFVGGSPNGEFYGVSEVLIHPSYGRFSLVNDICLLRLEIANTTTTPIPHLPEAEGLSNGDAGVMLDHVGFGYADLAKTEYGIKLHAEVPLAGLGCVVPGCSGSAPDTQFSYEQDGDPFFGPCNGDSGGPAFIDRGGVTYVAGITSYGDAGCDIYGVSTNVSSYETFINDFTGATPPGGDGGDGGGDGGAGGCNDDGVCDVGESCDGRNGTTACGDCPGQTSGRPSNRYCWVDGACEGSGC